MGAVVGVWALTLAGCALRRGTHISNVPPVAKCFVAGLVTALGMFVMLPAALEQQPPNPEAVLHTLCAALMLMYFIHHVLLQHQHSTFEAQHDHGSAGRDIEEACACEPPAKVVRDSFIINGLLPKRCPPVNTPLQQFDSPETRQSSACLTAMAMLLRALPYTIHAFIDGAVLGSAHTIVVLASLATSVGLCAVQDVGTTLLSLHASGATRRVKLLTVACFAIGFPMGATVAVAAVGGSSGSGFQMPLRAFAAGVFLYMAIFELAPPHAHSRLANLRHLCAFAAGMGLVVLSEAAESWAVGTAISEDEMASVVASETTVHAKAMVDTTWATTASTATRKLARQLSAGGASSTSLLPPGE